MAGLPWVYDDGGRAAAGFRGKTGDCGVRAAAIGLGIEYRTAYDTLFAAQRIWVAGRRGKNRTAKPSPSQGVFREVFDAVVVGHGWEWTPTMKIGSGMTLHLSVEDGDRLPPICIVRLSRHFAAVIGGTVFDTYDPCRDGTRAVYGYWRPA